MISSKILKINKLKTTLERGGKKSRCCLQLFFASPIENERATAA